MPPVRRFLPLTLLILPLVFASTAHAMLESSFLYFPTHATNRSALTEWRRDGQLSGYARIIEHPRAVWLVCHGNEIGRAHV